MNKENKMLHRYVLFVRVWKILGHENNNNKEKEKNFQTTNYSYFLKE